MRALCVNNGKYTGTIDSVEMYEAFRDGKIDLNPNVNFPVFKDVHEYAQFIINNDVNLKPVMFNIDIVICSRYGLFSF